MNNIPIKIKEVFENLKTEVIWLHVRWKIYRQLFAHSQKRIDLLNKCSSALFYVIQEVLIDEVQVSLSKLTDPARTGGYENLSLEQIQKRIEDLGDHQLSAELRKILDNLHDKCQVFRTRRNKLLAHLDLNTAMRSSSNALPGISRQMIEEALKYLRDYMNTIYGHYSKIEADYENFHMPSRDGEALVVMLKFAIRYQELIKDHKLSFDDFERSEWWGA